MNDNRYDSPTTEADLAERASERQPLPVSTSPVNNNDNTPSTPPSSTTFVTSDNADNAAAGRRRFSYGTAATATGSPAGRSILTSKEQREKEELARRMIFLAQHESEAAPTDADFEPISPSSNANINTTTHTHTNGTSLERALPALVIVPGGGDNAESRLPLQNGSGVEGVEQQQQHVETKLYPYRYFILAIFCCLSMSNAYQWLQYSILQDVIMEYYNVSRIAVDWTSMIYMLTYIPLIFPANWVLDKYGLRTAIVAGAAGNCVGACVKCFSADPSLFAVTFVGQTISAISQVFILGIPTQIAAVWFGPKEVSTACSIGVFGNQVGVSIGFVLPPLLVRTFSTASSSIVSPVLIEQQRKLVGNDLFWLFVGCAVVTAVVLIVVIIFFRARPPHPPSFAQARNLVVSKSDKNAAAAAKEEGNEISPHHSSATNHYMKDLQHLLCNNCNFMLLLFSYGINTGVYYTIGTLLNPIILYYFPNRHQEAGLIGLTIILAGMVGSIVCGIILDKTKKYKLTTTCTYLMSLITCLGFALLLSVQQMWLAFCIAAAMGFFMTGYLPVGFEFAVELTYPVQEGTSSGLLNASSQVFGIIFITALGYVQVDWSIFWGNILLSALLLVGFVMTVAIRAKTLRRAQASMLFSNMILQPDVVNGLNNGTGTNAIVIVPSADGNNDIDNVVLTRQNTLQNAGEKENNNHNDDEDDGNENEIVDSTNIADRF